MVQSDGRNWTPAQWDAIHARVGPLLVSAAAGSGKTAVLVERAISLICDEQNPIDADRLLVVTFTNAAAAEMKQRIGLRLSELARQNPSDMRLLRQQTLLARASIGTIHSFCLELIRQNFQHLPIAPDFTLAGEGELKILRQETAREVLEQFYDADEDGSFRELVELLSSGRNDNKVLEILFALYDFSRSHPFSEQWLEGIYRLYTDYSAAEETMWGETLLDYAKDTLTHCISRLTAALRLMEEQEEGLLAAYGGAISSDMAQYRHCLEAAEQGEWDTLVERLGSLEFERLKAYREAPDLRDKIQDIRKHCRGLAEGLSKKYINATRQDFEGDMADLAPKIRVLLDLTNAFSQAFTHAKNRGKRLDFADLEHLALHLLVRREEDGTSTKTPQAEELAQSYDAILVDEYQDVNEVQEQIFTSVSRQEENLFLVGDAKQSIYSFRLATPDIFLERKKNASPYKTGELPAKIALDMNFRSREEVTGAVNYIFSLLMSENLGDIEYEGDELLRCGAEYPESLGNQPEFLLLDASQYLGEKSSSQLEAAMIADKISRMLEEGHQVSDKGALRPAKPGDFCILMRSPKNRLPDYIKALENKGLPVWAQNTNGFLELREVAMVVSLLQALDNPLHDLPLAAAMLSPLFGFTDTELAEIRLAGEGLPFYRALLAAAEEMPPVKDATAAKCRAFLEIFSQMRTRAVVLPADKLLLEIYATTNALELVQVMPMGENRKANLLLLVEYAADYHKLGYKQLGGFVGFLRRLREREGDLEPAGLHGENADAVKIMSVHRSKGLEFPVVFLADTAKRFNLQDLYQSYQLHSRFGFACARREPDTLKQYATVPMQAIRIAGRRSMLGEEIRILYVALTRAKEKLIITANMSGNPESKLSNLAGELSGGKLNPRALEESLCLADWVMASLLHHPEAGSLREAGNIRETELVTDTTPWRIQVIQPEGEEQFDDSPKEIVRTANPDPELLHILEESGKWIYTWEPQTKIPNKLAVSDVAKGVGQSALYRFTARPRFLREKGLTPAEQGNAMHKFMQFANYHSARDNLEVEIRRMGEQHFLSDAEVESLDKAKLTEFFHGGLAGRIFRAENVWRELRFLGECGAETLGSVVDGLDTDGKVALQGVADCVFLEDGGAVIVDYKTDAVTAPGQLLERYREQLRLYKEILSHALPVPVRECLLYSFALGKAIPVL